MPAIPAIRSPRVTLLKSSIASTPNAPSDQQTFARCSARWPGHEKWRSSPPRIEPPGELAQSRPQVSHLDAYGRFCCPSDAYGRVAVDAGTQTAASLCPQRGTSGSAWTCSAWTCGPAYPSAGGGVAPTAGTTRSVLGSSGGVASGNRTFKTSPSAQRIGSPSGPRTPTISPGRGSGGSSDGGAGGRALWAAPDTAPTKTTTDRSPARLISVDRAFINTPNQNSGGYYRR